MKFVYLNLQEHPRGNYMLDCLVQAGLIPSAVVEERSSLAEKGRINLTNELRQLAPAVPLPRSLNEIVAGHKIRCEEVANHNDARCLSILDEIKPELIVLGDTRIILPRVMETALEKTVERTGRILLERLNQLLADMPDRIVAVRGRGMLYGVQFERRIDAKAILRRCFDNGLVAETCGPMNNVLKIAPPLTISEDNLDNGLALLNEALSGLPTE